ncbi:hypothetical protein Fcan01_28494 [Folsomia candida]|uniref:Uncharacterized protein n=1 Tax=Folsomia candida TaxID=158441 RepID=A0A226CWI9_FOLCA|nr:hypothetical protein Fcan01_28494 [Folsomia candida]
MPPPQSPEVEIVIFTLFKLRLKNSVSAEKFVFSSIRPQISRFDLYRGIVQMDYYSKVRSQFGSWYSLGIPYGQVTAGTCQIFDILRLVFVFHQRATLGYNIQLLLPPPPTAPPPS